MRVCAATRCLLPLALGLAGCAGAERAFLAPVALPPPVEVALAPQPVAWWREFDDPVLDGLVAEAQGGSLTLAAAWTRLAQAEAAARRSDAALLPTLDGSARADRTDELTRPVADRDGYALRLPASFEIDLWGRLAARSDAARLDAAASRADVATAALGLAAETAGTWYDHVAERRRIDVLDRQIDLNRRFLRLIEVRFNQGLAGAADVLRQRTLLEQTLARRDQSVEAAQRFGDDLAVLLGRPPGGFVPAEADSLPRLDSALPRPVAAAVLMDRPDVHAAYRRLQAADRRLAAAVADRYPRLALSAELSSTATAAADLLADWAASLAATASQSVFDGGALGGEAERSRAVAQQALLDYGQSLLSGSRDVGAALSREREQRRLIASLEQRLQLSNDTVDLLRQRYANGAASFLDVLDALSTLQSVELDLVTARRALIAARIGFHRATAGTVLPPRPEPPDLERYVAPAGVARAG